MPKIKPILVIVSAPSGAGKTTLCDRLRGEFSDMVYSISCTTRAPRGEEVDGEDYFFLTDKAFTERVDAGAFLEHAIVHNHRYGTLRETVETAMAQGKSVLMDIDVQGAAQIRQTLQTGGSADPIAGRWVDIFIRPPSLEVLRQRLEGRGEDQPEVIEARLKNADIEMARAGEYRYVVINDDLNRAYARLREVIVTEAGGRS